MLFITRRDGPEVLELAEEAFDEVSVAIEVGAERGNVHTIGHRFDVAPSALFFEPRPQGVAVVAAVGQEDLALAKSIEHVRGASPVMSLSGRQFQ